MNPTPTYNQAVVFQEAYSGDASFDGALYGPPDSGPYNAPSGPPVQQWTTFCVEADGHVEYFVPGDTYWVKSITSDTATGTGNLVTNEAKWLYWTFGTNPSSIVDYADTQQGNLDLQEAIWEGVQNPVGTALSDPAQGDLATPLDANASAMWNQAHAAVQAAPNGPWVEGVQILNIYPDYGYPGYPYDSGEGQSMLFAVPEPATMIVWSLLGVASWLGTRVWRQGRRVGRQPWSNENRTAILEIIAKR
ncbi:MAG: hypothetical protein WCB27_04445 [Thermoguttaceae bacterium]